MQKNKIYLHGYEISLNQASQNNSNTETDWEEKFNEAKDNLKNHLCNSNKISLISRTASQISIETTATRSEPTSVRFPDMEMMQATFLHEEFKSIEKAHFIEPLDEIWKNLRQLLEAFCGKQHTDENDIASYLSNGAKLQTIYYRFNYDGKSLIEIITEISESFDNQTAGRIDLKSRFLSLIALSKLTIERLKEHLQIYFDLNKAETVFEATLCIDKLASKSAIARQEWNNNKNNLKGLEEIKAFGVSLHEASHEWIYLFKDSEISPLVKDTLEKLSFMPGEVLNINYEYLFLDNPVWQRPYIRTEIGYYTFVPHAIFAFPFKILERILIGDSAALEKFSRAKANFLEDKIYEIINKSMPSARVYRSVIWKDPVEGHQYEHDILAVLGNQVFVFEAKSGKIEDSARRGGPSSLKKALHKICVEPGVQSARLEKYFNDYGVKVELKEKETGKKVEIDLKRPKAVYRFSVVMEGLSFLTSHKRHFVDIGLVDQNSKWAPIFSIGDLMMISNHLDSEVSFGHYLSRRSTLEEILEFVGDEQDILSMYLTNGLCIIGNLEEGERIAFNGADAAVRVETKPKNNRKHINLSGIALPPKWQLICKELYYLKAEDFTHRFDIIFTIINIPPPSLLEAQKRMIRWARGGGGSGKSGEYVKYVTGDRQYVLVFNFLDNRRLKENPDIVGQGREIATRIGSEFPGATDCVVFTVRRNSNHNFDAFSFFRVINGRAYGEGVTI